MSNENHPLFQSLRAAVDYCRDTPVLQACVNMLESLVEHYEYTGHPDDECVYEAAMRGDLETYYYTCMDIQEVYENVICSLEMIDSSHPSYGSLAAQFNYLDDKYGADSE